MGKSEIRYSDTIEMYQRWLIEEIHNYRDSLKDSSPYPSGSDLDPDIAFFGTGYAMSDFPSVFDMFGKFMAGLDVDTLYDQRYADMTNGPMVSKLAHSVASELSDDGLNTILPRYYSGRNNINSIIKGSFTTGKEIIETEWGRNVLKFDRELRYRMVPMAVQQWSTHLEWNKAVAATYLNTMKFYYTLKHDTIEQHYHFAARDKLWPFTILEYERAALSVVAQGGARPVSPGPSTAQKVASGALSGAATGAKIAESLKGVSSETGAIGGAILGAASGFL